MGFWADGESVMYCGCVARAEREGVLEEGEEEPVADQLAPLTEEERAARERVEAAGPEGGGCAYVLYPQSITKKQAPLHRSGR